MIIVLIILTLFLIIGQSTYSRTLTAIDEADSKTGAGCGCVTGMLAILIIGAVTLAAMVALMGGEL